LPKLRTGKEREFKMPTKCPVCGSTVERKKAVEKGQTESVALFCTNPNCFAQKQRQIIHFVSKKAFNIDGLGKRIVIQLMEESLLKTPADIFKLEKDDLIPLERFAEKSADNLIAAINQAKKISLARFIYALGIQHVGEETAIDLANHFGSLKKIIKVSEIELAQIGDIGPVMAKSIINWFSGKHNLELINELEKNGVEVAIQKTISQPAGPLAGKKIVVTGTLNSLSREEVKIKIRAAGGDWVSSVSKNTDYVVVGENPGSKATKAKELGVKIIEEKEFLGLLK